MKATYYLLNLGAALVFIFITQAQSPTPAVSKPTLDKAVVPVVITAERKDSMLKAANADLDASIQYSYKVAEKKEKLLEMKEAEQKALKTYIKAVSRYLEKTGRPEKIVVKDKTVQQLKTGEIFLEKDSLCAQTKRTFLGKPRCVQWKYSWYLTDKNGEREQLW